MGTETTTVSYGSKGMFTAFAAYEERNAGALPAVIVLQEIWGVDDHIRDVTRRYAEAGYFACAPDLYSENGTRRPGYEARWIDETKSFLNTVPPPDWHNQEKLQEALSRLPAESAEKIGETMKSLFGGNRAENYRDQLLATADYLHEDNELTRGRPIGSVGFCMGGGLSALLAGSYPSLGAAVIYYGRPPGDDVIANINCPVLGFYGETDASITPNIPDLAERMGSAGKKFESHIYRGAGHAFFNDTRASYHADAARDAYARTLAFFASRLATDPHVKA